MCLEKGKEGLEKERVRRLEGGNFEGCVWRRGKRGWNRGE